MELAVGNVSRTDMLLRASNSRGTMVHLCLLILSLTVGLAGWAIANNADNTNVASKRPLIVAIQYDQTYTMKDADGKWTGPMVDFWNYIALELKQPYTFESMSLSNIFIALQQGTVDVAAIPAFITAEREARFDFSTPLGELRHAVVTPYQTKREHPWLAAMSVFFSWGTLTVIFILLAMLVLLGVCICLIERKRNPEDFGQALYRGVGAGIYWAGSTLASGLCFGIYLKTLTGRILGLMWMILCGLALSAVIASLVHSLTDQLQEMQVIQDDELRYMHLGVKRASVQVEMLNEAGGYYTLYETDEDAMNAVLKGQVDGYLCIESRAYYYANHEYSGRISVYSTKLRSYLYALAMPKQSPLRRPINVAVLKLMDDSVWESLLDRYELQSSSGQPYHPPLRKSGR